MLSGIHGASTERASGGSCRCRRRIPPSGRERAASTRAASQSTARSIRAAGGDRGLVAPRGRARRRRRIALTRIVTSSISALGIDVAVAREVLALERAAQLLRQSDRAAPAPAARTTGPGSAARIPPVDQPRRRRARGERARRARACVRRSRSGVELLAGEQHAALRVAPVRSDEQAERRQYARGARHEDPSLCRAHRRCRSRAAVRRRRTRAGRSDAGRCRG